VLMGGCMWCTVPGVWCACVRCMYCLPRGLTIQYTGLCTGFIERGETTLGQHRIDSSHTFSLFVLVVILLYRTDWKNHRAI
jgi:hypothetical protein